MNAKFVLFIVFIGIVNSTLAQIATQYGAPIKWDKEIDRSQFVMKGIDTLSSDSILINREKYIRQNKEGHVLEELNYSKLSSYIGCSDDGIKLTGYWTRYYATGEVKEVGRMLCNKKFGEWLYFYQSGQIRQYEKYDEVDIIDSNPNVGYLNGTYLEYHPNGIVKVSGSYRIVEGRVMYSDFDPSTYEIQEKCCTWIFKSIKNGEWREYDNEGNIVSVESYNLDVNETPNIRELTDRYLEIDINDLYKK